MTGFGSRMMKVVMAGRQASAIMMRPAATPARRAATPVACTMPRLTEETATVGVPVRPLKRWQRLRPFSRRLIIGRSGRCHFASFILSITMPPPTASTATMIEISRKGKRVAACQLGRGGR